MNRRQLLQAGVGAMIATSGFASPPPRKVKIGFVGTTHSHAAGKLATLRRLTDVYEIVGVVEPDEARCRKLAAQKDYTGLRWLTSDQLLNESGLEAVVVETAVDQLVPAAMPFAMGGLHVHLEKPG